MTEEVSSFENTIDSFKLVCANLETKAELELRKMKEECLEDFAPSFKIMQEFSDVLSEIQETSLELINNKENISKSVTAKNSINNTVSMPCEVQSEVVNCISEIYNISLKRDLFDEKLVNENNKEAVLRVTKSCGKHVCEIKDSQSTIAEAKKNSNSFRFL